MSRKPLTRAEAHAYHLTKLAKMKRLDAYAAERDLDKWHYLGLFLTFVTFVTFGLLL